MRFKNPSATSPTFTSLYDAEAGTGEDILGSATGVSPRTLIGGGGGASTTSSANILASSVFGQHQEQQHSQYQHHGQQCI